MSGSRFAYPSHCGPSRGYLEGSFLSGGPLNICHNAGTRGFLRLLRALYSWRLGVHRDFTGAL